MKCVILNMPLLLSLIYSQPKEGIEFKVNTISGFILDSLTLTPLMDVNVDIYTGNNILKYSTITDEYGFFSKVLLGYLWKPKIKMSLHNYRTKKFRLFPTNIDSNQNITVNSMIVPVPENEKIPDLERGTLISRAETFFIFGNVFYHLVNKNIANRIIIKSYEAIEVRPKYIKIKVNDEFYDVKNCYVPQENGYENLSFILKSLLNDDIFENSGNPQILDEDLLKPSIIYGTVINVISGEPVMGAEIILAEPYNRRISDENGMYAFQVQKPGRYTLSIDPTPNFKQTYVSKPEIILKHGKGGWFKSNFYVQP